MITSVGLSRSPRSGLRWLGAVMVSAGLGLTSPDLPVVRAEAPAKKGGKLLKKEAVFTKAAPATVLIYIPLSGRAGVGSGVIIESQGLILTNAHVVEPASDTVQVFLYDKTEKTLSTSLQEYVKTHTPLVGKVVKRNRSLDLALVQLPAPKASYPIIELGESDSLQIGQDVVAIGNPLGLTWTFTTGTVSALRNNAIQTETPINHGNSGGPLLDLRARLVGINTFIRKDGQSQAFGFAIPVTVAQDFVHKWKTHAEPDLPPGPAPLNLSKNPVPLLTLVLRRDLEKLRQLNSQRPNRQAEAAVQRDLSESEKLGERLQGDELTVGQTIPRLRQLLTALGQHNSGARDTPEAAIARQVDQTLEHLKQIAEAAK